MRALVVGLGSIGKRHLSNLRTLLPGSQIAVWRHARHTNAVEHVEGTDLVVYDAESALEFGPEIAVVASPAPFHVPAATRLAEAGVHLLLEKPISHDETGVEALLGLCRKRQVVLMVGYNLRFSESLRVAHDVVARGRLGKILVIRAEVGSYLPDWRPGSDYHTVVSARAELGGGAVLELSHEIDYVRWLGGETRAVSAQIAELGGLGLQVEDTAEITLQYVSGGIAQIHVDMIQRSTHRSCRVIGSEGTLIWDAIANSLSLYDAGQRAWSTLCAAQEVDRNAMYLAELQEFIQAVKERRKPSITGEDGLQTLRIAVAAKRSAAEQRTIYL
jgi:predicted dehydrogenase